MFLHLLLCSVPLTGQAPTPVLLRYKFVVGRKLSYETKMAMTMNMVSDEGAKHPMNMTSESSYTQTPQSIAEDGTATLGVKYTSNKTIVDGKPTVVPGMDQTTTIKLSPIGEVRSIRMPTANATVGQLDLNSMTVSGQLPKDPVVVGASWDTQTTIPGMGSITLKSTVERIDASKGDVLVYYGGVSKLDLAKLISSTSPIKGTTGDGSGDIEFKVVFNATQGLLESFATTTRYKMTMKFPAQGQTPSMSITSDATQAMTMSRTK